MEDVRKSSANKTFKNNRILYKPLNKTIGKFAVFSAKLKKVFFHILVSYTHELSWLVLVNLFKNIYINFFPTADTRRSLQTEKSFWHIIKLN